MQSQKDICFLFKNNTLLHIELPSNPAVLLLGINPGETKTQVHTNISTRMFTPALFVIAKNGDKPKVQQPMNE